ncbi:MAG: sodium:neurotransmitter symporter [Bacillota bacterium]|jgi:NSS family neurotransmitter:Na+ symporter|nr:sodium:neurotransmitter symporter [Bacillota bacterium]
MKHTDKIGQPRDQFKSRLGFIMAAAGSAVGLGSIWRFPYVVGENGGGAYMIIYMLALVIIGIPVMVAEFVIGRNSGKNAVDAYAHYSKKYKIVGVFSMLAPSIILSFYCVVGGWAIMYLYLTLTGKLTGLSPEGYADMFAASSSDMLLSGFFFLLFGVLTILVVCKGISQGIEKVCSILMPALFIIMVVLSILGSTLPGGMEGIKWYLTPDFSKVDSGTFVDAVGQVFFTMSLGMGIMVTYASYLKKDEDMPKAATITIIFDTLVSVLAGFAIFPAVFAFGLAPSSGPGLVFITLPNVFAHLPFGIAAAIGFYLLLIFAALPSAISLLEVPVSYVIEKYHISRVKAAVGVGTLIMIIGIPTLLSFGPWSEIKVFGYNFFDLYDYATSNIALPIIGLAGSLILGFTWSKKVVMNEVTNHGRIKFGLKNIWYYSVKYISPILLIIVFFTSIGMLKSEL